MKLLQGQQLVKELRKLADSVTERLWIAVPYIGSLTTVRRVLGKQWFDSTSVSVKLLTDASDLTGIDTETIQHFHDRGEVKSLTGLHAKIYIVDDTCIISSANLTNTAFTKRHEIGVLCNSSQAKQVIDTFDGWWEQSGNVKPDKLNKIFTTKRNSNEERKGVFLPTLFDLPNDPGSFTKNLSRKFLNYDSLVANYKDFAKKYSSVQRIWRDKPLFLEIDCLFDYLFHQAPRTPSNKYYKSKPRRLTEAEQMNEINKWAKNFKEWNIKERDGNAIGYNMRSSRALKKYFSSKKAPTLTKAELNDAFHHLHCLNSLPINRTKILNNNSVSEIRQAINNLVNGSGQLAARMEGCNKINNLGTSTMNEILGFTSPDKYPLININANSGMRFFGYHIRAYN